MNAFIVYGSPHVMMDGGWKQEMYRDERADQSQRQALEAIFGGKAGSGWDVIAPFFAERKEPRYVPIVITIEGRRFKIAIEGMLESTVEGLKGADPEQGVYLQNLPNKIHGARHGLGLGSSRFEGADIRFDYNKTNAIFSSFSWKGP